VGVPTGSSGHFADDAEASCANDAEASCSREGVGGNDAEASGTGKGIFADEDVVDIFSGDEEDD
jgi:hypothetical protein